MDSNEMIKKNICPDVWVDSDRDTYTHTHIYIQGEWIIVIVCLYGNFPSIIMIKIQNLFVSLFSLFPKSIIKYSCVYVCV